MGAGVVIEVCWLVLWLIGLLGEVDGVSLGDTTEMGLFALDALVAGDLLVALLLSAICLRRVG